MPGAVKMPRSRGSSHKRDDGVVKLERQLVEKIRHVCIHKGKLIAEYVSDAIRKTVERDYAEYLRDADKPRD